MQDDFFTDCRVSDVYSKSMSPNKANHNQTKYWEKFQTQYLVINEATVVL